MGATLERFGSFTLQLDDLLKRLPSVWELQHAVLFSPSSGVRPAEGPPLTISSIPPS
jgi:hypothetical protein